MLFRSVLVHALCGLGAPPDGLVTRKRPGTAPLHVAAGAGNLAVVEALLAAGATVNLINPTHVTAVQLAAATAATAAPVLQVLLDAGAPVRSRDATKQTLLHHAARGGNAAAIDLLIARGSLPDINIADKWNRQPLHWAVLNGHCDAVRALLDAGAEAQPAPVPDRVHRRRTSLVAEAPAQLALRLYGPGSLLDMLVCVCARAVSLSHQVCALCLRYTHMHAHTHTQQVAGGADMPEAALPRTGTNGDAV